MKQPDHLFEETRPKLLGLAYRILGSYHDAEDVVQDVCEIWLKSDRKPQLWISDIFHFDLFSSEHIGCEAGYDVDECVCW